MKFPYFVRLGIPTIVPVVGILVVYIVFLAGNGDDRSDYSKRADAARLQAQIGVAASAIAAANVADQNGIPSPFAYTAAVEVQTVLRLASDNELEQDFRGIDSLAATNPVAAVERLVALSQQNLPRVLDDFSESFTEYLLVSMASHAESSLYTTPANPPDSSTGLADLWRDQTTRQTLVDALWTDAAQRIGIGSNLELEDMVNEYDRSVTGVHFTRVNISLLQADIARAYYRKLEVVYKACVEMREELDTNIEDKQRRLKSVLGIELTAVIVCFIVGAVSVGYIAQRHRAVSNESIIQLDFDLREDVKVEQDAFDQALHYCQNIGVLEVDSIIPSDVPGQMEMRLQVAQAVVGFLRPLIPKTVFLPPDPHRKSYSSFVSDTAIHAPPAVMIDLSVGLKPHEDFVVLLIGLSEFQEGNATGDDFGRLLDYTHRITHHFHGQVAQIGEEAIICTFSAVETHAAFAKRPEEPEIRACRAAFDLVSELGEDHVDEDTLEVVYPAINLSIVLTHGHAQVGAIASHVVKPYCVVGQLVVRALQFEKMNAVHHTHVLCDSGMAQLVADMAHCRPIDRIPKGRPAADRILKREDFNVVYHILSMGATDEESEVEGEPGAFTSVSSSTAQAREATKIADDKKKEKVEAWEAAWKMYEQAKEERTQDLLEKAYSQFEEYRLLKMFAGELDPSLDRVLKSIADSLLDLGVTIGSLRDE